MTFTGGSDGKESAYNAGDPRLVYSWLRKISWRREWLPTLVFWPGEFHGLYSPWGHKESDKTEQIDETERISLSHPEHYTRCWRSKQVKMTPSIPKEQQPQKEDIRLRDNSTETDQCKQTSTNMKKG